jgi:indole-3-glycerol phosphate synthase
MILDKIVEHTKIRLETLKAHNSLDSLKAATRMFQTYIPYTFENALKTKDIAFICEVKKASPSKGIIAENFPYLQIAKEYEDAGANAISVLTEPHFFMGKDEYLKEIKKVVNIPVLRKDFIIDPYQIYEAQVIGADAVLLICTLLDTQHLKEYMKIADSLGLSCLVEAHDEEELHSALEAGARVIGVNNRNLKTFEVDITISAKLRKLVPKDKTFVSESGIKTQTDISILRQNGTNAVLIGETLMRSGNIGAEMTKLREIDS